jgi:ribosomal protein L29
VIYPDGQAVVYHLNYLFTTNIREPVRADEKHLGRVRQHFIDTDVVSGNYELREVSTYRVALKAARSARGVPFLEDIPVAGVLFRPAVNAESSLQENVILSQTVIYPTLFDLMGLRWAPAVAELDSLSLREREFVAGERERFLTNEVFDEASGQVDNFMRIEESRRRADLYRTQETIPHLHPNGYQGPGLNIQNGVLQEGYIPESGDNEVYSSTFSGCRQAIGACATLSRVSDSSLASSSSGAGRRSAHRGHSS